MSPLASLGFSGGPSGSGIVATGGTISSYINGKYKCHFFNTNGTFAISSNPNNEMFTVVIVGGGGSGGGGGYVAGTYRWSGAGGASGSFDINSHWFGTYQVDVVVGGSTGNSSVTYNGNTSTAYGGPSGTSNYPNNNFPPMPAPGIPQSGNADIGTYTNQATLNITGNGGRAQAGANGIQGQSVNHAALFAAGLYSGFGGVGARGWDAYNNSPGLYNSGNGAAGGQSAGATGYTAAGYGCGGGGGGAPSTNNSYSSGGAGSGGGVWIMYRA